MFGGIGAAISLITGQITHTFLSMKYAKKIHNSFSISLVTVPTILLLLTFVLIQFEFLIDTPLKYSFLKKILIWFFLFLFYGVLAIWKYFSVK